MKIGEFIFISLVAGLTAECQWMMLNPKTQDKIVRLFIPEYKLSDWEIKALHAKRNNG